MKAILTYHSLDNSGSPISLSPTAFEAHLRWLTSGRVRVLSLDDLVRHPVDGGDVVAVTFDDGFLNTRTSIEALLREGFPVTLFVVSGQVGGTNAWNGREQRGIPTLPLLAWNDLEDLVKGGATVGAHTRTHRALTELSGSALDDELRGAADDLQKRLGVRTPHVAYPYGDVNDAVAEQAARYYRWGYTTDFRVMQSTDDPTRLPRLDMYYFRDPEGLASWGSKAFSRRLTWIRARRRLRGQ